MNKRIEMLKNELAKHSTETANVEAELQKEYNKIFDNDTVLKELIERVTECAGQSQNSQSGYMFSEDGCINFWYRFEAIDNYRGDMSDYLDEWIGSSHGIYIDWKNAAAMNPQGGGIVVDRDGSVYDTDSRKTIISKNSYKTDAERNALIEAHMERTGYFPGVFKASFDDELFFIDTRAKK